jgi:hypothetical protein
MYPVDGKAGRSGRCSPYQGVWLGPLRASPPTRLQSYPADQCSDDLDLRLFTSRYIRYLNIIVGNRTNK